MVKKSAARRGVHDGLLSATILFCLDEFTVSKLCCNDYTWYLVTSIIAVFLSIVFFLLFAKFTYGSIFRYYGVGRLTLVFSLLMLLVNDLVFHIQLFPRRELASAEGFVLFAIHVSYLLYTELLRLALSALIYLWKNVKEKPKR